MANKLYIKSIRYLGMNRPPNRRLKITLSNGAIIKAQSCYEGWQQWGGTTEELSVTMSVVIGHLKWLHGGPLPWEEKCNG